MPGYTPAHAESGLSAKLPTIEAFPSQFSKYDVTIVIPEYTSMCPKTGLADFGTITICYVPDKFCVELKSLKTYMHGYRNLGIFYENAVNRILRDFVKACKPASASVKGEFNVRGGMRSIIETRYERKKSGR